MTLGQFIRIFKRNIPKMFAAGLLAAGIVLFLVKDRQFSYTSHTLLNTGLVTGYNLERSSGGARVDMNFAENEMGNLINLSRSNEIIETLCLRLMSEYFSKDPAKDTVSIKPETWPLILEAKEGLASLNIPFNQSPENLFDQLSSLKNRPTPNALKELLFSKHDLFGKSHLLSALRIRQEGRSDILRIEYSTLDPGICLRTLQLHTELFVAKKMALKELQSKSVLEFFEKATRESSADLRKKEDELLAFSVKNKIINYYEQTRYIAAEKEDLDDLFFKERMDLASSDSSLYRIEKELGKRINLPALNSSINDQRKELGYLRARIARLESLEQSGLRSSAENDLQLLRQREAELDSAVKESLDQVTATRSTPEGVEISAILKEWLDKTLQKEITNARLSVFKVRKNEFDDTYSRFAPWGSNLKRMEREIDVAERAYLENLHSYNQARLHQFNTTLSGALKIEDPPVFPEEVAGSNPKIMVVAAFIVAALMVIFLALVLEIFDSTLRSPLNASSVTGLPLAGAIPLVNNKLAAEVKMDQVVEKAYFQAAQAILTAINGQNTTCIALISLQKGEGKSFCLDKLAANLYGNGLSESVKLVEMPALMDTQSEKSWASSCNFSVLVVTAGRGWTPADVRTLELFQKRQNSPIYLLLNKTHPDYLDETLGEIPRYRSLFRRKMKAFLGKLGLK